MNNYITVDTICGMISRNWKSLTFDKYDVAEWCGECIKEIGSYDLFTTTTEELKVRYSNGNKPWVELPCGLYRLLHVFNGSQTDVSYEKEGNILWIKDSSTKVYVRYLGILTDKEGLPLIPDYCDQACYYYCLRNLIMEDVAYGKFNPNMYKEIDAKCTGHITEAAGSMRNVSYNDMNELSDIMYNMVRRTKIKVHTLHK